MSFQVLLYYFFTELADPEEYARIHREKCEELNLRGRILVATEGINGSLSGLVEDCAAYMDWVRQDSRMAGIEFKIDPAEGHVFHAMYIRVRPEIITLGVPLETPVHVKTGPSLTPEEWRSKMASEDVVILDGRNDYESDMGRFKGAICPPLESFRDFPAWIQEHRSEWEGKTILTYCTGGIRCEKLTAWMMDVGFENVYQLHGGIVMYGQDPATRGEGFEGINVVFDDRIAVPVGDLATPLTRCRVCEEFTTNYVNCANVECNKRLIMCPACELATGRSCDEACRTAPRQRRKGQKLSSPSLLLRERL
ncbi:MAG: rhodanese-related sulfurtransferase [Armatimonadetes bacterium]|nr:rhodanese-related sulfurtransferase [Armatimonadota bacterium]